MLEGADLTTLEVKSFSGADVGQNHQAPQPPSSQVITTDEEELKIYHGNCHCGAFKFSAKIPELKSARTCNCSLCLRVISSSQTLRLTDVGVEGFHVALASPGREPGCGKRRRNFEIL